MARAYNGVARARYCGGRGVFFAAGSNFWRRNADNRRIAGVPVVEAGVRAAAIPGYKREGTLRSSRVAAFRVILNILYSI